MSAPEKGIVSRRIVRLDAGTRNEQQDELVREEPLEIRIFGDPIAVTMRTPGDDPALVAGFLLSEGVIQRLEDLEQITVCGTPGEEGYGNVIEVKTRPGLRIDLDRRLPELRRGTLTSSACGVCGRATIDDLLSRCGRLPDGPLVPLALLASATARLEQPNFARTGGLHGAAALTAEGALLESAEDVGRHNAVDKVVGKLLKRPADAAILAVSGRTSFEIVQKAVAARIPLVASVSAVSSLAADLAEKTNLTLAGFVRGGRVNLYSHPERVR